MVQDFVHPQHDFPNLEIRSPVKLTFGMEAFLARDHVKPLYEKDHVLQTRPKQLESQGRKFECPPSCEGATIEQTSSLHE